MNSDSLIISLLFFFHITASVNWSVCMAVVYLGNLLVVVKNPRTRLPSLNRKRLFFAGWLSLAIIGITGMFQMSANPAYEGFLAIDNPWSVAIFGKHLLVLVFLGVKGYLTMIQEPSLIRAAFLAEKGIEVENQKLMQTARSENRAIMVLGALFVLILWFTSLARAA